MTTSVLNWMEPPLLEQVLTLAQRKGQAPEALIKEAIVAYLTNQDLQRSEFPVSESDPLIGLFAGSPNLATDAEEILYGTGANHV